MTAEDSLKQLAVSTQAAVVGVLRVFAPEDVTTDGAAVVASGTSPLAGLQFPAVAASVTPTPGPVAAEAAVDEFALYREAHRAHFVEHDYAAALTRWDRYLAATRHGSLVPEARYNRALALYHLGRRDEASAALRPFANGAYGRYRRDEASRLLESLSTR